ncbi:MAG TPA: IclR family transcriptional regulator [Usitatibacter sp.]|nr:IclR family transcriptional regulator [Usitatibacter sp.]
MRIFEKARSLLQVIGARPGIQLPELSRTVGMPKSSVHRLLRTLASQGFLEESGKDHGYNVGPLIRSLAGGEAGYERLIAMAHPGMVALRDACNETVALHVLEANGWMTVDQIESTHDLRRTITNIGVPMPLHATATGKLFLAYMPHAERARYIEAQTLARFTPNTLTSKRRLLTALDQICRDGYAMSRQEMVIGVAGISMPIWREGRVSAAIGVSGPLSRFTPKSIQAIRNALKKTTKAIEAELCAGQPAMSCAVPIRHPPIAQVKAKT